MTMPILRLGLMLGALGFLYVSWASFEAGFPVEIALVRGMVSFMALSFVAYVGELVVATAPAVAAEADASADADADEADTADDEPRYGSDDTDDGDAPGTTSEPDFSDLAALIPRPASPGATDNDELQAA